MRTAVRSRWLLTMVLLLVIGGAIPMTVQGGRAQEQKGPLSGTGPSVSWNDISPNSGDFVAAYAQIGEGGVVGDVLIPTDTVDDPGGACGTHREVSPATMEIAVKLPEVTVAGSTAQTIRFFLGLWQVLPDGGVDFVGGASTEPFVVNPGERTPADSTFTITNVPAGPRWLPVLEVDWYDDPEAEPTGWTAYHVENLATYINRTGEWEFLEVTDLCYPLVNPVASLAPYSGTVNSNVAFKLFYFPAEVPVAIMWDAKSLGETQTDFNARATGSFKVPDGQVMGDHTVSFTAGDWKATRIFTVKPRIKVIPGTVQRGDEVKISLRGYKAFEPVKIRWRDGAGTWREIARITTSASGSGQVYLPVPLFAPDGANSVRGDSLIAGGARAQTNAVTVTGGPVQAAAAPTPTPTATPSPSPTPTAAPASPTAAPPTPEATATQPVEPTMEPTAEPTAMPTEEPTTEPALEPTTEPAIEPTVQPTDEAGADVSPTVEEGTES